MGLCKCPKRQVTTQFCFEHRVNVCEHCMVQNHTKCIVQSYLQWLRDSDYVSNCTLCGTSLENGDCVRLVCYHVFHWDCLNARQAALPANTTPRGHLCPSCKMEIFPTSNLVSPVADVLKSYLSQVNWGRNGLGLALLADEQISHNKLSALNAVAAQETLQNSGTAIVNNVTKVHQANNTDRSSSNLSNIKQNSPHSVLLMDAFGSSPANDVHASSRRPLLPRQTPIGGSDSDENKYKRRTPAEIFSRWSRRLYAPSSRPPWRRTWFLVMSGILAFIIIVYLMALFGRSGNRDIENEWENHNPNQNLHYD